MFRPDQIQDVTYHYHSNRDLYGIHTMSDLPVSADPYKNPFYRAARMQNPRHEHF